MKKKFTLAILASLFLTSCMSSQFVQTNNNIQTQPKETSATKVELYLAGETPQREYDVLGHIQTTSSLILPSSNEELMNGLREKAKEVGADAVIKVEFKYFHRGLDATQYVEGIAVRYK